MPSRARSLLETTDLWRTGLLEVSCRRFYRKNNLALNHFEKKTIEKYPESVAKIPNCAHKKSNQCILLFFVAQI